MQFIVKRRFEQRVLSSGERYLVERLFYAAGGGVLRLVRGVPQLQFGFEL